MWSSRRRSFRVLPRKLSTMSYPRNCGNSVNFINKIFLFNDASHDYTKTSTQNRKEENFYIYTSDNSCSFYLRGTGSYLNRKCFAQPKISVLASPPLLYQDIATMHFLTPQLLLTRYIPMSYHPAVLVCAFCVATMQLDKLRIYS
jgi:hypothetical protein